MNGDTNPLEVTEILRPRLLRKKHDSSELKAKLSDYNASELALSRDWGHD